MHMDEHDFSWVTFLPNQMLQTTAPFPTIADYQKDILSNNSTYNISREWKLGEFGFSPWACKKPHPAWYATCNSLVRYEVVV